MSSGLSEPCGEEGGSVYEQREVDGGDRLCGRDFDGFLEHVVGALPGVEVAGENFVEGGEWLLEDVLDVVLACESDDS